MTVRSSRTLRLAATALLLSGGAVVGTAAAANASMGCGDYSFGFEGTRLLNDGISDSAGPFTISMPAGTYDITIHSFDDHIAHPGQTEQTQEQWYFTLDNGYTSPVSSDIPDDQVSVMDTFEHVVIEDATAITVHHLGAGGINSVAPACIGFTIVMTPPPPVVEPTPEPPVVVPEPEVAGPVLPPKQVTEVPDVVTVEVKPGVEINAPPASSTPVPAPAPQLALTGPSAYTWVMILTGAALMVLGGALVIEERRRSLT